MPAAVNSAVSALAGPRLFCEHWLRRRLSTHRNVDVDFDVVMDGDLDMNVVPIVDFTK